MTLLSSFLFYRFLDSIIKIRQLFQDIRKSLRIDVGDGKCWGKIATKVKVVSPTSNSYLSRPCEIELYQDSPLEHVRNNLFYPF